MSTLKTGWCCIIHSHKDLYTLNLSSVVPHRGICFHECCTFDAEDVYFTHGHTDRMLKLTDAGSFRNVMVLFVPLKIICKNCPFQTVLIQPKEGKLKWIFFTYEREVETWLIYYVHLFTQNIAACRCQRAILFDIYWHLLPPCGHRGALTKILQNLPLILSACRLP